MSASTWQATKALQYLKGIFCEVPAMARLVENITADTISLSARVDIEVRPASFRTSRGGTCVSAIGDEVAFWRSESTANPDREILNAIRPGLGDNGRDADFALAAHTPGVASFTTRIGIISARKATLRFWLRKRRRGR